MRKRRRKCRHVSAVTSECRESYIMDGMNVEHDNDALDDMPRMATEDQYEECHLGDCDGNY